MVRSSPQQFIEEKKKRHGGLEKGGVSGKRGRDERGGARRSNALQERCMRSSLQIWPQPVSAGSPSESRENAQAFVCRVKRN